MNTKKLVENRMRSLTEQQKRLVGAWKPYIDEVNNFYQEKHNRKLNSLEERTLAQVLTNALDSSGYSRMSRLNEETTEDAASFLPVQLPVISALLPSQVLNEISVVQAMDRRTAAVFFLNVTAGNDKGAVSSGDTLIGAGQSDNDNNNVNVYDSGHTTTKAGRRYAMAMVEKEVLSDSVTGGSTVSGTVDYSPGVINFSDIVLYDGSGTQIGTTSSSGTISGDDISGSISADGTYSIDVDSSSSISEIAITYFYQYDLPEDSTTGDKTGVPEINFNMAQSNVEALDFPVRAKFSLGAAMDLMKAHGINLEDEVVRVLGNETKFTIDHYGIDQMYNAAVDDGATQVTDWDPNVGNGEPWLWKRVEFEDRILEGSNNIFKESLRGVANYILCGNNVARVIRQLKDNFKPSSTPKTPTGPIVIGKYDGMPVIQDPFLNDNHYVLGYKGDSILEAGFVYAPYLPLYATPTLQTSDLMSQKGFYSAAGFKVVNPKLFTYGRINAGASDDSSWTGYFD